MPAKTGPAVATPARGRGQHQRRLAARAPRARARSRERERRGVTGVDTAQQGFDEPVHDLVAESRSRPARRRRRPRRRRAACRESRGAAARRRRPTAARAATCATSAGTPITERGRACSDPRDQTGTRSSRGGRPREPELAGQVDALRSAGQHRLRADVDLDAGHRPGQQLATGPRRAFQHQDLAAGRGQSRRQPARRSRRRQPRLAARLGHAPSLSPAGTEPVAGTGRRTPMRTTRFLAVSATALLLTACSGGSDGDSPDATTAMDGRCRGRIRRRHGRVRPRGTRGRRRRVQ